MTVYVDDRRQKKGNLVLSVMTSEDVGELTAMSGKASIPEALYRADDWPLYEVTDEMRQRAIDVGAEAVPQYKLKRMMTAWLRGLGKDDEGLGSAVTADQPAVE